MNMTPHISTFVLLVFTLFLICFSNANLIDELSFSPPFTSVGRSGARIISNTWKTDQAASVNENFIRLTPNQQSKKGVIWSLQPVETDKLSMVLKFRISGPGQKFFGDGLAIWFLRNQRAYPLGDLHGIDENFEGFGVVVDTFKNTETLKLHKDVSVLVNDKSKTIEQMLENAKGCDAKLRYYEERPDFSFMNTSRIKILLSDLSVSIFVDAKGTGDWKDCTTLELPFLPGWLKEAYIGITASTGQLTDNHDVVSLITYSDDDVPEESDSSQNLPLFSLDADAPLEKHLIEVEKAISDILSQLDLLQHHLEHEIISAQDGIKAGIEKLQSQEEDSEGRITKLEKKVVSQISSSVDDRLARLEQILDQSIIAKISKIESDLENKVTEKIMKSVGWTVSWKLPFFHISFDYNRNHFICIFFL